MSMGTMKTNLGSRKMNNIYHCLCVFFVIAVASPLSLAEESDTGFYAVESNGDTITLKQNAGNQLTNDGEVYEAKTSRESYRKISKEEAEFLKKLARKKVQLYTL